MSVLASLEVEIPPAAAFDVVLEELRTGLERLGLFLEPGPGGRVLDGSFEAGRVAAWKPGEEIRLEWRQASWKPEAVTRVVVRFEAVPGGTRVTVEHEGFGEFLQDRGEELAGWFAHAVAAPLIASWSSSRLGDWITDRAARRPSGRKAKATYQDPLYHRPNFQALLGALDLTPKDRLLDVGCGGGAFLKEALKSGCRAAGIDHSADMVRAAVELNRDAVLSQRLEIHPSDASRLPFADGTFTCAVCTGVFGFLPNPEAVLREIHRVLAHGGRLAVSSSSKELRGTPAAPEPMASRLRFYEDAELESLARAAGFTEVRIDRPDLSGFAREAGIPDEHLGLFEARNGQILVARKG